MWCWRQTDCMRKVECEVYVMIGWSYDLFGVCRIHWLLWNTRGSERCIVWHWWRVGTLKKWRPILSFWSWVNLILLRSRVSHIVARKFPFGCLMCTPTLCITLFPCFLIYECALVVTTFCQEKPFTWLFFPVQHAKTPLISISNKSIYHVEVDAERRHQHWQWRMCHGMRMSRILLRHWQRREGGVSMSLPVNMLIPVVSSLLEPPNSKGKANGTLGLTMKNFTTW